MKLFLILMAMGVVTYGTRSLPLLALGRRRIPEPVRRFFRGFPVAVLAAFAAPLILAPEGTLQLGYHNLGLMAAFRPWRLRCGQGVWWRRCSLGLLPLCCCGCSCSAGCSCSVLITWSLCSLFVSFMLISDFSCKGVSFVL